MAYKAYTKYGNPWRYCTVCGSVLVDIEQETLRFNPTNGKRIVEHFKVCPNYEVLQFGNMVHDKVTAW